MLLLQGAKSGKLSIHEMSETLIKLETLIDHVEETRAKEHCRNTVEYIFTHSEQWVAFCDILDMLAVDDTERAENELIKIQLASNIRRF
jgi:hypothetical protein